MGKSVEKVLVGIAGALAAFYIGLNGQKCLLRDDEILKLSCSVFAVSVQNSPIAQQNALQEMIQQDNLNAAETNQHDYSAEIEKVKQDETNICDESGFKNMKVSDKTRLDTLLYYWKIRHGVTIESPFEYDSRIKAFVDDAVKNICPNDHEARIKAVFLKVVNRINREKIELNNPVTAAASESQRYFDDVGEFLPDCNRLDYHLKACLDYLGYESREVEVLTDCFGKVIKEIIIRGKKGFRHVCLLTDYGLIDAAYTSKENPLFGFGIKHKVYVPLTTFSSIYFHYSEKRDSIESLKAEAFLRYRVVKDN